MNCGKLGCGVFVIYLALVPFYLAVAPLPSPKLIETSFIHRGCDKSIVGHILASLETHSMIDCLVLCINNDQCKAVTYNDNELKTYSKTYCNMKTEATPTNPYEILSTSDMCYVTHELPVNLLKHLSDPLTTSSEDITATIADGLSTTEMTTLTSSKIMFTTGQDDQTTITSSNRSFIIGAVETVQNMCDLYSYFDIALLTLDGVYLYDSVTDLYSAPGPCKPVQPFSDVFHSYPDLPEITEIDALMSFNTDRVEIYANNKVWSIIFAGSHQYAEGGYPMTFEDHLKRTTGQSSISKFPEKPEWGTLRSIYGTQERYFKENGHISYYANFLPYYAEISDVKVDVLNVNNININPWGDLPDNTVDVMLSPSQYINYIVFTADLKCYRYQMDYTGSFYNDPATNLILKGEILFS